ncbi:MAG: hypothetical protein ACC651_04540 [Candidatus Scalindua sp.]
MRENFSMDIHIVFLDHALTGCSDESGRCPGISAILDPLGTSWSGTIELSDSIQF